MQPLSDCDENMPLYDDTMIVSVSGTVTSSSRATCSFYLHGTQFVCGQHAEIAVRAIMDRNPKWKNPLELLPEARSLISFDGVLQRFESYTPPNTSDAITCAVVTVEDITFLIRREDQATATQTNAIREKIKNRQQNRRTSKVSDSTPDNSQNTSSPSTSQNVLGKRKMIKTTTTSEDEVDNASALL